VSGGLMDYLLLAVVAAVIGGFIYALHWVFNELA
jgi:hypothetical protein